MMTENVIHEKIARISDILEQIETLNNLIDFQKENHAEFSTIQQYEYMRKEFVEELGELLKEFKLRFPFLEVAA